MVEGKWPLGGTRCCPGASHWKAVVVWSEGGD